MISEKIVKAFGYNYDVLDNYIKDFKPVPELEWVFNSKNHRVIRELKDEEKERFDYGFYILQEMKPDLNISYNDFSENKITIGKQRRKLFKYINNQKLSEEIGKYKLPNKKLYLIYSTNFEDFLLSATKNPWTNCNNLENGDFRYTSLGNIFMNGRFIVYITDLEEKEYLGLKSYKMFFRAYGFINQKSEMVTNIWYPIKKYFKADEKSVSVQDTENKISKYGFNKIYNNFGIFVYPYLDYSVIYSEDDNESIVFQDEYYRFDAEVNFKDYGRKSYPEYIKFSQNEINFEKDLWKFCDNCGSKKEVFTRAFDLNLCPDCYEKYKKHCNYCGKDFLLKDLKFTEDNKWICSDCQKTEYKYSPVATCSCGTLIKKKGEKECRFCRSPNFDAYNSNLYTYLNKNGNLYSYKRHFYMGVKDIPPYIKFDEEVFADTEKYVRR